MKEKRFQLFAGGEPRPFALLFEKVQMQSLTGTKKAPRSAYVKSIREPSWFCSWNTPEVSESVASCKVEHALACVFASLTQQCCPTILDTLRRGAGSGEAKHKCTFIPWTWLSSSPIFSASPRSAFTSAKNSTTCVTIFLAAAPLPGGRWLFPSWPQRHPRSPSLARPRLLTPAI